MSRSFGEHIRDFIGGETPPQKKIRKAEDARDAQMKHERERRENPPWRDMPVAEFLDIVRNLKPGWENRPFDAVDVTFMPQAEKPFPWLTGEWHMTPQGMIGKKMVIQGLNYYITKGKFEMVPADLSRKTDDIPEVDDVEYLYLGGTERHGDGMRGRIPVELIQGVQVVDVEK